jgi:hypothetical protein
MSIIEDATIDWKASAIESPKANQTRRKAANNATPLNPRLSG